MTAYLSGGPASAGNRRAGVPPTTPELQQMLDLLFPGTGGVINSTAPPATHTPAQSFLGLPLRGATRLHALADILRSPAL